MGVSDRMAYESFRNWQARSIDQKQSASSLLIALAGGAIAFVAHLLSQATEYVGFLASVTYVLAFVLHALSIGAGLAFTLNRVRDFDLTAQVARKRESDPKYLGLKKMRLQLRRWGRLTRRLYAMQVILFGLGMAAFIAVTAIRYRGILLPSAHAG